MSWRISEQEFLIRGRSYPISLSLSVNRVKLPDGALINSSNEARVLDWYSGPSTSTLEECLYVINIHYVIGSRLSQFFWTGCYGREPELEETVCLRGLDAIAADQIPFDAAQITEEFHRQRANQSDKDR
jgi:hypothetical protein